MLSTTAVCQGEFYEPEYSRRKAWCEQDNRRLDTLISNFNAKMDNWNYRADNLLKRREELKQAAQRLKEYYQSILNKQNRLVARWNNWENKKSKARQQLETILKDEKVWGINGSTSNNVPPPEPIGRTVKLSNKQLREYIENHVKMLEKRGDVKLTATEREDLIREMMEKWRENERRQK